MIVLDTNIIIYYIKSQPDIVAWIERHRRKEQFAISTVTATELLSAPQTVDEEFFAIEHWLKFLLVVDVDLSIAREAARIRRSLRLNTMDSIIAATAVILHAPLATRDIDFKRIRDIHVIVP